MLDVYVLDLSADRRIGLLLTPEQDRRFTTSRQPGDEFVVTGRGNLETGCGPLSPYDFYEVWRDEAEPVPHWDRFSSEWPRGTLRGTPGPGRAFGARAVPTAAAPLRPDPGPYERSRAELDSGYRPPHEQVRVESFVGALPSDDPPPTDGLVSATFEEAPSPWTEGYDLVRVGLRVRDEPRREPLHLVFAVDTSRSMGAQLYLVQASLGAMIARLGPDDTVALVSFADAHALVLPPTPAHDPAVPAAFAALQTGGYTQLGNGLRAAYRLAAGQDGVRIVVLCTDGYPTYADEYDERLAAELRPGRQDGIDLAVLEFGREGNRDQPLRDLAAALNATYAEIDARKQGEYLEHLLRPAPLIALDATAEIAWDPEVVDGWRWVGTDGDVPLAPEDLRASESSTALFEVHRNPRPPRTCASTPPQRPWACASPRARGPRWTGAGSTRSPQEPVDWRTRRRTTACWKPSAPPPEPLPPGSHGSATTSR